MHQASFHYLPTAEAVGVHTAVPSPSPVFAYKDGVSRLRFSADAVALFHVGCFARGKLAYGTC